MDDFNSMLKRWRDGTDGLAPPPEVVERIRSEVRVRSAEPVLARSAAAPLARRPRSWPMFFAGLVSGLVVGLGFSLFVTAREPVAETARMAPELPVEPRPVPQVPADSQRAAKPDSQPDSRATRAEPAFPFIAQTLDGQRVSLKELAGKVVVIDFWATGCGPCWSGMADLTRVAKKHQDDGTVFLAVARDSLETLGEMDRKHAWPVIADPQGKISASYPVSGVPTYVVIDRKGRIFEEAMVSGSGNTFARLEKAIAFAKGSPDQVALRSPRWIDGSCEVDGKVVSKFGTAKQAWVTLRLQDGAGSRWAETGGDCRHRPDRDPVPPRSPGTRVIHLIVEW